MRNKLRTQQQYVSITEQELQHTRQYPTKKHQHRRTRYRRIFDIEAKIKISGYNYIERAFFNKSSISGSNDIEVTNLQTSISK
jgi:hypothetical protein